MKFENVYNVKKILITQGRSHNISHKSEGFSFLTFKNLALLQTNKHFGYKTLVAICSNACMSVQNAVRDDGNLCVYVKNK